MDDHVKFAKISQSRDEPNVCGHRIKQQSSLVGPFCNSNSLKRTSSMTSPIRPFLSSILCCVIAFGHAPAWLHVATCDGHSHAKSSVSSEKTEPTCSHCCHHQHDDEEATGQELLRIDGDGGSHHEHDSGNCLICQSLASPCGVTWQINQTLVTGLVFQPAFFPSECLFASASLSIAHPRGPPVVA